MLLVFSAETVLRAQAEAGTAALRGSVADTSGGVVAGAKVRVTNQDTGQTRAVDTTEAGIFDAPRLPAGKYTVDVAKSGFRNARREGVELGVGTLLTLDITLEIGETADAVTVVSEIPVVETGRTETSALVNERAVRDLPINGRNFLDFTILTPGVVKDTRVGDLSFGGQRGPANSLLIDGMDANSAYWGQSTGRAGFRDPYAFSQDAVEEFQVLTSSFAPEFGRATGGVVNVVTKSGTNTFHGSGFWFFRDRAMNANTYFNNLSGIPRQPYHYNQFGGNLGGPVVRNRLFFFYNYDGLRNTLPNPVYLPVAAPPDAASQLAVKELSQYLTPYTTGYKNDIHTMKADWLISPRHSTSVRYNLHRFFGANQESPGPQSAANHSGNTTLNTDNITASHTWVLEANKLVDQRFEYLREDNPSSVSGTGPEVVVRQNGVTALSFGTANFLPRYTKQGKYAFVETFSWTVGSHTIKAGHDFKFERAGNLATNLFAGQYTFNSYADFANTKPASFAQSLPTPGTAGGLTYPNTQAFAGFVQDSWRASSRLTVNYGVRYDLFLYDGNGVRNPDPGLAALGLRTGVFPIDYTNVAGRLGVAYRLSGSGKYVIRAGAGTFYGALAGLVPRTVQAQNGVQVQSFTLTGAAMPQYPNVLTQLPPGGVAAPDIYVMQPDFKTPRTHQWSFQLEAQIAKDTALTLGYLGVRGTQLTRVRDINQYPYVSVSAHYADGTPVTFLARPGNGAPVRPNAAFGRISLVESGADSTYHGGFIQVNKRYATGVQILASYTFSKVIDDKPWGTSFIPNSGSEDPNLVQDTLNPNADRGVGDSNITHRFVLSGVWDIPFGKRSLLGGWQLSTIVSAQSGHWYSAFSNVDLNNDGNRYTDRSPGYGRNTIEGPGFETVDLRVSKAFRMWREGVEMRLIGEAFNALNRANFATIQQVPYTYNAATRVFTANPAFLQPTSTYDPRILQIAARFTF